MTKELTAITEPTLVGKVCRCSKGRDGIVTGRKQMTFFDADGTKKLMWHGVGLDGQGLWASENPAVVADSLEDYERDLLVEQMRPDLIARARDTFEDEGRIEIDDNAKISTAAGERGAYVQAWVWLEYEHDEDEVDC